MAMENSVADRSGQTACTIQNVKRIALLRTDRNRIYNCRFWVVNIKPPLVIVKMKNMGFFYTAVNQSYFSRIANR